MQTHKFEVVHRSPPWFTLELAGSFGPGWAGDVASGLASANLNIARGWLRRTGARAWRGQLALQALEGAPDPGSLDFASMLCRKGPPAAGSCRLKAFALHRSASDLAVEVQAVDALGFLASMLRLFGFLSLFPHEILIETDKTVVHDVFRLRGMAGDVPSPLAEAALVRRLEHLSTGEA